MRRFLALAAALWSAPSLAGSSNPTPAVYLTNSIGSNVQLNNSTYTAGPSVAQGTIGTWFASGTVTLLDTTSQAVIVCKLWDGTTVIDSGVANTVATNVSVTMSLSGKLTSPAGNIRISCLDVTNASGGNIMSNASGNSLDSTVTVSSVPN